MLGKKPCPGVTHSHKTGSVNAARPDRAQPGRGHQAGLRTRARDPRRRVRGRRRDRGPVGGHRVGPAAPRRGAGRLAAAHRRPDGAFPDRAVLRRFRQRPGIPSAHARDFRRHFPRPGAGRRPAFPARPHQDRLLQRGGPRPLARADDQEPRRQDDPRHRAAAGRPPGRADHRDRARVPLRQRHDRGARLRRRQRRRRPDLAGRAAVLGSRAPHLRLPAGHRRERGREPPARTGARSTPCWPPAATSTGCCAAAGWPSSSPAGAPRC